MRLSGKSFSLPAGCTRTLLVAALAAVLTGVSGCSIITGSSGPCMPPGYTLDSFVVAPGGTLRISAPEATCNPRYGEDAKVRIDLVDGHQEVLLTELAPMSDAGAFSHSVEIPASLKAGSYGISAVPDGVDWCDDTGHNNRLENPGFGDTGLGVVRSSCAVPYVEFRVAG